MRVIFGAICGMKIGRGNRSTRRNLPQRHFVHKIPHDQTRAWTPDRRGGKPATNRLSSGVAPTEFSHVLNLEPAFFTAHGTAGDSTMTHFGWTTKFCFLWLHKAKYFLDTRLDVRIGAVLSETDNYRHEGVLRLAHLGDLAINNAVSTVGFMRVVLESRSAVLLSLTA
jgi:hypothetical protein